MKKIILIAFISIVSVSKGLAQENDLKIGGNYYFITNLDEIKNNNDGNNYYAKKDYLIKISEIKEDKIIFTFWNFNSESKIPEGKFKNKHEKYNTTNQNEMKFFSLKKERFEETTSPYFSWFRKVDVGIHTIPFKLRLNEFEFESNLSLGTNVIIQYGLNRRLEDNWLIDITGGLALTKIELNSENSDIGKENTIFFR